jgi:hypothetical protein
MLAQRPVHPENPKRLKVLTFSSHVPILIQCAFDPSPSHGDEVSDDATCNLCSAGLCRSTMPLTAVDATGNRGPPPSARRLPAIGPQASPPADGSVPLGLARPPVGRVARHARLRATPYSPLVATELVPGVLATIESKREARPTRGPQRNPSRDQTYVTGRCQLVACQHDYQVARGMTASVATLMRQWGDARFPAKSRIFAPFPDGRPRQTTDAVGGGSVERWGRTPQGTVGRALPT